MSTRPVSRCAALVALALVPAVLSADPVRVKSPDGRLEIAIATVEGLAPRPATSGQLAYSVDFGGKPVIEWSNLGLLFEGAPALGNSVRIGAAEPSTHDETWNSV